MQTKEKVLSWMKIKQITSVDQIKMPGPSAPEAPQSPYTQDEAIIVGRIKMLIGGDIENIIHTADEKLYKIEFSEAVITRRKAIVHEVDELVKSILRDRTNERRIHTMVEFDTYLDTNIDKPEYLFLTSKPSGVNVNGWGLFAGLLNPLEKGEKIGPNVASTRPSNWRSGH